MRDLSSNLPACQFGRLGSLGSLGSFDCPGLRLLRKLTAISGGPKMEPPSIPTAMPLEDSFYFEYLEGNKAELVSTLAMIAFTGSRWYPHGQLKAAGNRQWLEARIMPGEKYAGALRTTHTIVSHRREPWSRLGATAACLGAQRARIRRINCS